MKIAVVGPFTWFAPHFPEQWQDDTNVLCLNIDEFDYKFLITLINFRPDITLFYRPEIYPRKFIEQVSGLKIAFLSEPIPSCQDGMLLTSPETDLRMTVYGFMDWDVYDQIYFYDRTKKETVDILGWPVTGYRSIPIDTDQYHNANAANRDIDIFFVGKATPYRIEVLDFLRSAPVKFQWIAHGVSGSALAALMRRSKVVLNIHADGLQAVEPRVHLAALCGCVVLSEPLEGDLDPISDRIVEFRDRLNLSHVQQALEVYDRSHWQSEYYLPHYSVRQFLADCMERNHG